MREVQGNDVVSAKHVVIDKTTYDDLKDVKIGERYEIPGSCGSDRVNKDDYPWINSVSAVWKESGKYLDGNPWPVSTTEFEAVSGNECRACWNGPVEWGYECPGKYTAPTNRWKLDGRRVDVRRKAWAADRSTCCSRDATYLPDSDPRTCAPAYRNSDSFECKTHMVNACNKTAYSGPCLEWAKLQIKKGVVPRTFVEHCQKGKNFGSKPCQEFCKYARGLNTREGNTVCDQSLENYCNESDDERCECVNPSKDIKNAKNLPPGPLVCWYKPCAAKPSERHWMTGDMKAAQDKCVVTNCTVNVGDVEVDGLGNTVIAKNSCGSSRDEPEEDTTSPAEEVTDDLDSEDEEDNTVLIAAGGAVTSTIMIVICCISMILIMTFLLI